MFILFDLIYFLYCLIYLPYLLLTRRWHQDFGQRFGFFAKNLEVKIASQENVWIHAVSVGEVMAIEGFIAAFKRARPDLNIVLTVTTKTGYELAKARLAKEITVIASPLDFSWVVEAFVQMIKPRAYIVAETEIWPNLFSCLFKQKVPIAIINGRISDRSLGRYQMIKAVLKPVLGQVSIFAMQSEMDKERIIDLGAPLQRVFYVGNIKFDGAAIVTKEQQPDLFKVPDPVWVAGSTHPGEEKIVLKAHKQLCKKYPAWQLIIAPRHIERIDDVVTLVREAGLKEVLFSSLKGKPIPKDHVCVVDTIGHLRQLYALAQIVFVGKSLCVGGGHNVIEPGIYGKAIIVGPMTENFRDIIKAFRAYQAIIQVKDAEEFTHVLLQLAGDPAQRHALGVRAKETIIKNQGAIKRTLDLVQTCL